MEVGVWDGGGGVFIFNYWERFFIFYVVGIVFEFIYKKIELLQRCFIFYFFGIL